MKRIILITMVALLMAPALNSQIRMGVRGGINTAYFKASDITAEDEHGNRLMFTTLNDATVGFHGGVMVQVSFFGLFLQPELLLTSLDSEVRVRDLDQTNIVDRIKEQSFTKLDFPVLIGKRFGPARVGIGPVGTIMLSSSSELDEFGLEEQFNSATFGYQLGVGLDVLKFLALDLKYEGNLSKLGSGIKVGGQEREFDSRSRQFIVSVGIFF